MYNKLLILALCVLLAGQTFGQSKDIPAELYKASTIPDSLKKDADAVVRYSMMDVTVKAAGKETLKTHTIVTILNEQAKNEAEIEEGYNKFVSVGTIEMIVYDADGKVIKKYHKGDMYDRKSYDGISIITDARVIGTMHTIVSYPVTVEQTTEVNSSSYINLPSWYIQHDKVAIQNTSYHVLVNNTLGFRFKADNISIIPQKATVDNMDSYTWSVKNIKAIRIEDGALHWRVFPKMVFATNLFEYDGIRGDFTSWKSYGSWQQILNNDVCSLPSAREEEIRKMTADIKTDKEKARFLYEYMQKNTRYVSIQLGIGGFKPFPATFVDQKKYGDCKALSNYMTALLKAVNIPSYYAIVRADANEEPADPSFPNDRFNHIIVCVPLKGDTTWLECTNSTQPFGKLGTFTENRNALIVTENGGKLVNTPKSTVDDNQFNSEVHLILQPEGGATVKMALRGSGGYRDQFLGIELEKADMQKEQVIRNFGLKQPSVLELKQVEDKDGIKQLDVNLEYDKFCDIMAGGKLFYKPRAFDLWRLTVPTEDKRTSDYYFEHPMKKTCVTTIDLPAGFEIESMPTNASLKFTYGNYEVNYAYDAAKNQVVNTTKFILTNHVIPAAKYNEMQQYMDAIAKAQNKKLVIRKKA